MSALAAMIAGEVIRFPGEERLAEALRAAAWYAIEDGATSAQFGDAAAEAGLHRQGAMNRYNEAKKNLAIANGE